MFWFQNCASGKLYMMFPFTWINKTNINTLFIRLPYQYCLCCGQGAYLHTELFKLTSSYVAWVEASTISSKKIYRPTLENKLALLFGMSYYKEYFSLESMPTYFYTVVHDVGLG